MHVKSLVKSYIAAAQNHTPLDDYIAEFPALFKHYFSFWADASIPFLVDIPKIEIGEQLIQDQLPYIEEKFAQAHIDTKDVHVVLFVGQNASNGHAALLEDEWWVWIPVEAYSSSRQVNVFVSHEILHGLHYAKYPGFYFQTQEQKQRTSRQIVTEGIATMGAMQLMNLSQKEALWADLLSDVEYNDWLKQYEDHKNEIFKFVIENWDRSAGELFQANDRTDISRFRGGYKLALEVMQMIAHERSITELLSARNTDITELSLDYIKRKSRAV